MKRILSIVLAVFILSATFYRCSDSNAELKPKEVQVSQIDYSALDEETRHFGDGLNLALGKHLHSNGTGSRISSNLDLIELQAIEYMDQFYDGYSENYYLVQVYLNQGSSNSRITEEGFNIDSIVTNPVQRYYIDLIGAGLIPALEEYDASSGDTTNLEAFKAFYSNHIDNIIFEIIAEESLSDSIKQSLIVSAYMDKNTIDARVILSLDDAGILTGEDIQGEISANGRTTGFLKKAWRKIKNAHKNIGCALKVYGTHLLTGAAAGWAFGQSFKNPDGDFLNKTFVGLGSVASAIIGGGIGGLKAGYKIIKKGACS